MFGHRQSRSGRDKGGRRRDIEAFFPVSSRSTSVNNDPGPRFDRDERLTQGACTSRNLLRGFPFEAQGGEEGRDLSRRRIPRDDFHHCLGGLTRGERALLEQGLKAARQGTAGGRRRWRTQSDFRS